MSRVWVSVVCTLFVVIATALVVYGLMSGAWMWGLVFGVVAVGSAHGWLTLRATGAEARRVADRMVLPLLIALTELARLPFIYIESRIAGEVADE